MINALLELSLFSAKAVILVVLILLLFAGILAIASKVKEKLHGRISIKNINEALDETKSMLCEEVMPKKDFKAFIKSTKIASKKKKKKNIYILDFNGDIKASQVTALRQEITAILGIATAKDEVLVRLESGGGMVNTYGLAAAQLERIKAQKIPLTISIDKIAASGGYMMAAIANKIIAAPFSIVGSIGVIVQLPNFNKVLKDKNIDFEQITAGNYKRTLTMFGENTNEGRDKLHQEIEEIHTLFKDLITENRPQINIDKVATGEHWLAKQAIDFNLVDDLQTSDDYLLNKAKDTNLYEIKLQTKKSLGDKLMSGQAKLFAGILELVKSKIAI